MSLSRRSSTLLATMRRERPLVQCITNYVSMNVAANVMLAAGASPAMVHAEAEAAEFSSIAAALTVNIGTISPDWALGMQSAARSARALGKPWVFDPVAHFATGFRRTVTAELLALSPTIIRGNASEIIALNGEASNGSGVDSGDAVALAEQAARDVARERGAVVAVTGEIDFVTDGRKAVRIEGGSALMPQVTALGCSLTALVGAFAAVSPADAFEASVAALALFAVAGERAGRSAEGPGSFAWRFLDELAAVDPDGLEKDARIVAA